MWQWKWTILASFYRLLSIRCSCDGALFQVEVEGDAPLFGACAEDGASLATCDQIKRLQRRHGDADAVFLIMPYKARWEKRVRCKYSCCPGVSLVGYATTSLLD